MTPPPSPDDSAARLVQGRAVGGEEPAGGHPQGHRHREVGGPNEGTFARTRPHLKPGESTENGVAVIHGEGNLEEDTTKNYVESQNHVALTSAGVDGPREGLPPWQRGKKGTKGESQNTSSSKALGANSAPVNNKWCSLQPPTKKPRGRISHFCRLGQTEGGQHTALNPHMFRSQDRASQGQPGCSTSNTFKDPATLKDGKAAISLRGGLWVDCSEGHSGGHPVATKEKPKKVHVGLSTWKKKKNMVWIV